MAILHLLIRKGMLLSNIAFRGNCLGSSENLPRMAISMLASLLVAAVAISLSIFAASPASASAEDTFQDSTQLSPEEAAEFAEMAELSSIAQSGEEFDSNAPSAWRFEDGSVYVNYPIADTASSVEPSSSVGALVSPEGEVISTFEMVLTEIDETSGHVEAWVDGQVIVNEVSTAPEDASSMTPMSSVEDGGFFFTNVGNCFSDHGISAWAIGALGTIYGAACAVTFGAGCVACLGTAAGASGSLAGHCVGLAIDALH